MFKLNGKKGFNVTYILVTIIISIISFFVYLSFYSNLMPSVVSNSDDLLCRAYISAKTVPHLKAVEYFHNINNKCKQDEPIKIDLMEKDKSFEKIATNMARCWYRYGEGKQDFMNNFGASGNWCFVCGKIELEENAQSVSYKEFVEWTSKNNYNKTHTFFEYIALKYTDVNNNELESIRSDYRNLLVDDDTNELKEVLIVLGDQINYLDDLRFKQFSGEDKSMYVVYRYDRIDDKFEDKLANSGKIGGAVTLSVFTSIAIESFIEGAIIGGTAGLFTGGVASVPMGIMVGVGKVFKAGWTVSTKTVKTAKKLLNVKSLFTKLKGFTKVGSKISEVKAFTKIYLKSGKVISINSKIKSLKISVKDLEMFIKIADDAGDVKSAENLKILKDFMKELDIDDLNDIDKALSKNPVENIPKLNEIIKNSDYVFKDKKNYKLFYGESYEVLEKSGDLKALKELAVEELASFEKGIKVKDTIGIKTYLKTGVIVASGAAGAFLGASYSDDYNQYVDIVTQEQYYRLCGTEYYTDSSDIKSGGGSFGGGGSSGSY